MPVAVPAPLEPVLESASLDEEEPDDLVLLFRVKLGREITHCREGCSSPNTQTYSCTRHEEEGHTAQSDPKALSALLGRSIAVLCPPRLLAHFGGGCSGGDRGRDVALPIFVGGRAIYGSAPLACEA